MSVLSRIILILGIPSSIICLFWGFWLFMDGIMTYPIPMMIYGAVFWFILLNKMPRNGIRRR